MAAGLAPTTYANKVLNHMHTATASTAPAGNFVQLHTADPGVAGTTAVSAFGSTGRKTLTFNTASAGAVASSNAPQWATWASGTETITHISVWDAASTGNFLYSIALATSKTVTNGDTLNLTSTSVSLAPLAA
jgi:hypothetical protein